MSKAYTLSDRVCLMKSTLRRTTKVLLKYKVSMCLAHGLNFLIKKKKFTKCNKQKQILVKEMMNKTCLTLKLTLIHSLSYESRNQCKISVQTLFAFINSREMVLRGEMKFSYSNQFRSLNHTFFFESKNAREFLPVY